MREIITYLFFLFGFFVLVRGATLLIEGSSSVAKKFKIPTLVIGLTIVAFGTSAPEFVVNVFASFKGSSEIAIGNILGSNIANIFLILGISSTIYPLAAKKNTVLKEIPLSLLAVVVFGILANDVFFTGSKTSFISKSDGLVLLCFFIIFLYYTFSISKSQDDIVEQKELVTEMGTFRSTVYILLGLIGLSLGGKWIVDGAVSIASHFHVSQSLIGLTIVAIGTSLPELATSAVAAYKKQPDIAIGNVVGSNIFNIFWILGASAAIRPLPFLASSNFDVLVTMFASIFLFLVMFVGRKHVIERWQGMLMVLMYVLYIAFLIHRG